DSLENVLCGKAGKGVINLTNGTTYSGFIGGWIYASVTADEYKNIEINIDIGGNTLRV
ncbi:24017_t:CDS:1, partial [Racocetra persica]